MPHIPGVDFYLYPFLHKQGLLALTFDLDEITCDVVLVMFFTPEWLLLVLRLVGGAGCLWVGEGIPFWNTFRPPVTSCSDMKEVSG